VARVLLVSSGEAHHHGLGVALQAHGLDVRSCLLDPDAVAEAVAAHRPEVALVAAGPDRREAAKAVRAARSAAWSGPVMVLAHPDMGGGGRWAFEAGAAGYMLPSVSLEEVVAAVRALAANPPDPEALRKCMAGRPGQADGMKAKLSDRQREILECVSRGLPDREIARVLSVSGSTVHREISKLLELTGASNRTELTALAVRLGLVDGADVV